MIKLDNSQKTYTSLVYRTLTDSIQIYQTNNTTLSKKRRPQKPRSSCATVVFFATVIFMKIAGGSPAPIKVKEALQFQTLLVWHERAGIV